MNGMIDRRTAVWVLLWLFALVPAVELRAQLSSTDRRAALYASLMAPTPASKPGGPVTSKLVDPFMTAQQEARIHDFLNQPYEFDWGATTTLRDIHRDLARHLSIVIDFAALEELAIPIDEAIHPELAEPVAAVARRPASEDPFGGPNPFAAESPSSKKEEQARIGRPSRAAAERNAEPRKWWRGQSSDLANGQTVSNAARLFYYLDRLDLTLNIRHGQLAITTWEQAEQACCLFVFDVTPLVETAELNQLDSLELPGHTSYHDMQALMDLIESSIHPDTWESLGGPSTISAYELRNRRWITVSSMLVHYWQIKAFLIRLNE